MYKGLNKIALTFDLDDWYHTPLISGSNFSHFKNLDEFFQYWGEKEYDFVTEPTLELLHILKNYGIKATFFIIADMIDRYPVLVEALKSSGHEIAHHSLNHTIPIHTKTKKQIQSKELWEEEFVTALNKIENTFDKSVLGYRAPGAYIDSWMLKVISKYDIKYDSSIAVNSFFNKTNFDFKNFPDHPFKISDTGNHDLNGKLTEIPWLNYSLGGIKFPAGGAFFFRLLGYNYFKKALIQKLNQGDTVFYLHALDLNNKKFPMSNNLNRPFYWINKGNYTYRRFIKLLEYFKSNFVPAKELILN